MENGESTLPAEFIPFLSNLYGVTYNEIIEGRANDGKDNTRISERFRQA